MILILDSKLSFLTLAQKIKCREFRVLPIKRENIANSLSILYSRTIDASSTHLQLWFLVCKHQSERYIDRENRKDRVTRLVGAIAKVKTSKKKHMNFWFWMKAQKIDVKFSRVKARLSRSRTSSLHG